MFTMTQCMKKRLPDEPEGYLDWHAWAEKKFKTHKQVKCDDCGLYHVWVKRNPDGR